jgi:hypothetical protein
MVSAHQRVLNVPARIAAGLRMSSLGPSVNASTPSARSVPPKIRAPEIVTLSRTVPRTVAVQGTVRDLETSAVVPRANVSIAWVGGVCPCNSTRSGSSGAFSLEVAPGVYTLNFTAPGYAPNTTTVVLRAGTADDLGTVFLEEDGRLVGVVEGFDPTHEPVSRANVSVTTRVGTKLLFNGSSYVQTTANGSFNVTVWPVAERVDFSAAPSGKPDGSYYLGNHTFADPAPGETVDLGVVYLVRATNLTVHLVDRVTGLPIPKALPASVTSVGRLTSAGGISRGEGPTLHAWAFPGADELDVVALGYLENRTPIPAVPELAVTASVDETVNLTPEGAIVVTVDVTGGDPTSGGNATPGATIQICAMSAGDVGGFLNQLKVVQPLPCVVTPVQGFGGTILAYAPPSRDEVTLSQFMTGAVPLFGNVAWVNITPDEITRAGFLNFTPGAYIEGRVAFLNGSVASTGTFTIHAQSTDEQNLTGPACSFPLTFPNPPSTNGCLDRGNFSRLGCPYAAGTFCLPAPPGPVVISVSMANPDDFNAVGSNYTWAEVTPFCCASPPRLLQLDRITSGQVQTINVTALGPGNGSGLVALGEVSGRVVAGAGAIEPALTGASVRWCSVSDGTCNQPTFTAANGSFNLSVPIGWGQLRASAMFGYSSNATWVDVGANSSAGTITLSPLATVIGRVVDPAGDGVLGAGIGICAPGIETVVSPSGCTPFPNGTGSGGYYGGEVAAGPYPGYVYELTASASGYLPSATWFNATVGGLIDLPALTLAPVGPGTRAGTGAPPPPGVEATWLTGRVVDGRTGAGIDGVSISACPFTGSACLTFVDPTNTYGQFNQSIPTGNYYLYATSPGYAEGSFFLNASGASPRSAGTLALSAYAWVAGRVAVRPAVSYYLQSGLGPGPASVQACASLNSYICGLAGVLNTAGEFNVTAPPGHDTVDVSGTPLHDVSNATPVTVGTSDVRWNFTLPDFPALALDAIIAGQVLDGSDRATPTAPPRSAVPWPIVDCVASPSPSPCGTDGQANGSYLLFVAPSDNLTVTALQSAFVPLATTLSAPGPGQIIIAPTLNLTHYGWIQATIRASSGARVPFAAINYSVSIRSAPNSTAFTLVTGSEDADESGFANMTVYPSAKVNLSATGPGYGPRSNQVPVYPSVTTAVNFSGLLPVNVSSNNSSEYLRSLDVNDSAQPSDATVQDLLDAAPVPQALLWVEDASGGLLGQAEANAYGQFMIDVSPADASSLTVTHPGYVSNSTTVPRLIDGSASYATINLTADGVIAGQVVSEPGNLPSPDAYVTACATAVAGTCTTVGTNGSGIFWFLGPPGSYVLNVTADTAGAGSLYNGTMTSDGWTWLGHLTVESDGTAEGTVLGLPFELPIVGANVTICPTNGGYFPYCSAATPTDPTGSFTIPVPAGDYYLNVSAAGYAPWSLEIEVAPGELFNLGTIPLDPLGAVQGTVADGTTELPIAGANVTVCNEIGTICAGWMLTGADGSFLITGVRPGPELLIATAPGYTPGAWGITVPPGKSAEAGTFYLWPGGAIQEYPVTGQVVWNDTGAPASGMTVRAEPVDGGSVAAIVSGPDGSFVMTLQPGRYALVADGPGARTSEVGLTVGNASVSGITIRLDRREYTIAGTVTVLGGSDGLGGISVDAGDAGSVVSGVDGSYRLALPNGSYTLTVGPVGAPLAGEVGSVELGLTVNGAGTTSEDVALPTVGAPVLIEVVSGDSGRPVGGAAVTVMGGAALGVAERANGTTGSDGTVTFSLPTGVYVGYVNASGYPPARVAIDVGAPAVGGTYRVVLEGPGGGATTLVSPWALAGAIVGIIVAATAIGVVLARRRLARPKVVESKVAQPYAAPEPGSIPPRPLG